MANIDEVMYWIMKISTLEVQKNAGVLNSIYGGRYKSSLLINASYRANTFKYILRNPVKANFVSEVQESPYSVCTQFGCEVSFALYEVVNLFEFDLFKTNENLEWLNNSFNVDEDKSISQGLLRPGFRYCKDFQNRIVEPDVIHPRYVKYDSLWEKIISVDKSNSNQISLF
ncbi:hypothetical protein [Halobacteriovorax sp. RT-2-6]|uniref:hypothetical protein n=1 Tax=unclassified Halobacteriovorax TaxID=2639665 RepID=UPI00399A71C3